MTVRRLEPDVNTGGRKSEPSDAGGRRPLLTLRAAVILLSALIAGAVAGVLAYLATHNPAAAVLAGGSAFVGAIKLLDTLID